MTKTQYDKIAKEYAEIGPKEPIKIYVFIPTLKKVVGNIAGKRALDLGCGNGLYTRVLKVLGAKEVVGVDSSKEMIKFAIDEENKKPLGIKYLVQDIRNLKGLKDFDIVVAGLVLHYAKTKEEIQKECDCIYKSLKQGRRFIAIISKNTIIDYKKYGFVVRGKEPLKEGDEVTITIYRNDSQVSFEVYYWKKSTYEEVLRKSGFKDIKWLNFNVSDEGKSKYDRDYWDVFLEDPQSYLLECKK